jgi:enterochelin esterase-like enzyme
MRAQCVPAALCCLAFVSAHASDKAAPLVIGETFTLQSKVLSETRRINVYLPSGYAATPDTRLPVLYMPDGGLAEDFLHVAGLVQVSVGNGTMRPFVLVGIVSTATCPHSGHVSVETRAGFALIVGRTRRETP